MSMSQDDDTQFAPVRASPGSHTSRGERSVSARAIACQRDDDEVPAMVERPWCGRGVALAIDRLAPGPHGPILVWQATTPVGPSRSGFQTSDPRSSPSKPTNSHSRPHQVDTKPTTRSSSTHWPTTSETGGDLDCVGGQRVRRQSPPCRHRARRPLRRHRIGDRVCACTTDPPDAPLFRLLAKADETTGIQSADGRHGHHDPPLTVRRARRTV